MEEFLEIYEKYITRPGADKLLEWLRRSDFFTAPASTRFHLARPGGLVEHSVHVYRRLRRLYISELKNGEMPTNDEEEKIAIIGLLHDICKVNFYSVQKRNRKNANGEWEQYDAYFVEDFLPYGHGEKSVYIVSAFMKLSREEAMAIRWHMGFSDDNFRAGGYSVGNAFEKYPLAVIAHMADLEATYFDEVESAG